MESNLFSNFDLFHGEASTTLGRVYARLPAFAETAGCTLAGRVVGPICRWAKTLPATSLLVPRTAAERSSDAPHFAALLAEAVVPDPCFWSDELPMRYTVELNLQRGNEIIASANRTIAFRDLGRRGRSLFQQSRRWVPRGMSNSSVIESERADLAAWRLAPAVLVTESPTDELCNAASELGVWVIADLSHQASTVVCELARLAKHAAVFLAILPPNERVTPEHRTAALNLLLAEQVAVGQDPPTDSQADCLIVDATDKESFARIAGATKLPVLARRPLAVPTTLAEARRAADTLQCDLTQFGDFAGYLV